MQKIPAPYDHPILEAAADCSVCAAELPLGAKPIFRIHPEARVALISQAPGRLAHLSGIPWNDPSGRRLRSWLGVTEAQFYQTHNFAILPIGFCYPGKGKGGDLPPRPECAPLWQEKMLGLMPKLSLKILVGAYAQAEYLGALRQRSLTETVRQYETYLPEYFPLPHPSPRNQLFLRKNPWMEEEIIPVLRAYIQEKSVF